MFDSPVARTVRLNAGPTDNHGRVYIKLCHFPRPEAVTAAAASTALGRIAVKMAELLMNSAIVRLGLLSSNDD